MMNDLFKSVVSHPIAVVMVATAAAVFGLVSYNRLPVELMPDLAYPTLTVRTTYEGAAPAEMEAQISRPIEEGLATLDGLRTLQSRSRAGASDVILGFDWGTDMAKASQTVRESLQTNFMPDEAERPLLLHFDPSLDPILRIALSTTAQGGDLTQALSVLREIGEDEIKRELEAMDGVAAVRIRGGLERELRVEVREDWLAGHGITLDQVQTALAQENVNLAGGSILQGDTEYLVRTLNEYTTVAELEQLGIRRSDGQIVQLNQVATVAPTVRDAQVVARMDGSPAVELEVFRTADSNIVDVAARVKSSLFDEEEGLVSDLPDGVSARILDDQAEFIVQSIANLTNTAILGGFLAIGILFLFLRNFRATAIIGTAIPVSIVAAFAPLYLGGVSLNLMSLGGLALGIGMLVDNAVVVLESIQRYLDEGKNPQEASVLGVADVATAVTASTLTTVAVFLPIAFVEGVAGQLFGDLAIAVVASLVASLVATRQWEAQL
jgi:HAE1 family hydrophobic/amphiphilic exporter-1